MSVDPCFNAVFISTIGFSANSGTATLLWLFLPQSCQCSGGFGWVFVWGCAGGYGVCVGGWVGLAVERAVLCVWQLRGLCCVCVS